MKESIQSKIFNVFNILILLLIVVVTLYPFLNVLAQSFSADKYVLAGQISIIPKGFTLKTYQTVMHDADFWIGYKNTIIYTVVGTIISLIMTTMLAYPLSKKRLKGRSFFIAFTIFTMFFNGGIIPNYLLVKVLGMRNTMWAVIIPGAISTYNLIIMMSFFQSLPVELEEAASVDGMNTYQILLKIILPLSKPIMATMALFYAVAAWNNWFGPFLYFDDKALFPVTLFLRNIVVGVQQSAGTSSSDDLSQIAATVKSATIILAVLPILCVYPFIQKYFVTGVLLGSVKG